jgi:hypothetical protein
VKLDVNKWADFWYNDIGVNVIPADSIAKRTFIKWKDDTRGNWQVDPIPLEIHEEWKKTNAFDKGMAVICGKVFRGENEGKFLCAIDADNKKGIEEMTSKGIEYIADRTLVEQHPNNKDKAHFYFYTTKPMQKKSSDAVNFDLMEKMNRDEIPALEMKGDGTHGIMYCTPSPHKDGSRYEIIGNYKPMLLDEIGEVVNKICDKYSLGKGKDNLVPMQILMEDDTRILEGANRHEGIMRYAESMLRKYPKMEKSVFNEVIKAKNKLMCSPPLTDIELYKQIEDATKFIAKQLEEERELRTVERNIFGTDEFWKTIMEYKKAFKPDGKFIKCLECKVEIDDNALEKKHYGHKVMIK